MKSRVIGQRLLSSCRNVGPVCQVEQSSISFNLPSLLVPRSAIFSSVVMYCSFSTGQMLLRISIFSMISDNLVCMKGVNKLVVLSTAEIVHCESPMNVICSGVVGRLVTTFIVILVPSRRELHSLLETVSPLIGETFPLAAAIVET